MKCFATALKAHEAWMCSEPDGVLLNLRGEDLTGVDFSSANLSYANLSYANLSDANLSYADLSDADLSDANLHNADMVGVNIARANLTGANLTGRTPLHADTRRGYVLYVIQEAREPMFVAGCRTFTLAQAREHWGEDSESSQPEYIAAIEKWVAENTSQTAAGAGSTV